MNRLTGAERRERLARWLIAPAADVARGLESYGDGLVDDHWSNDDAELERALLERGDPLILLALGRYAAEPAVLRDIFQVGTQPPTDTQDAAFRAGLRATCLGNSVRACSELSEFPTSWMGEEAFANLIKGGDQTECQAVLSNRCLSDKYLIQLFGRQGPFDGLDDKRWTSLVAMTASNARLVTDLENEEGPDLGFMHIHEAILKMLAMYPITFHSSWGVFGLLEHLNPFILPISSNREPVQNVLDAWRGCSIKVLKDEELEGEYTQLTKVDELRCLVASYYGRFLGKAADSKPFFGNVGAIDSPDVAMRCAVYGNDTLTPEQMEKYFARDGTAFTLSALSNDSTFRSGNRKVLEETCLMGRGLIRLYASRCDQFAKKYPSFDARPLSETGQNLMERVEISPPSSPNVELEVSKVRESLSTLEAKVAALQKYLFWGIAVVLFVLIAWRK